MKRMMWWTGALILVVVVAAAGCDNGSNSGRGITSAPAMTDMSPAAASASAAEIAQKTCPVMGGAIDPNQYVDYEGRRIYFCCGACKVAFGKEPEKYLAKVDEELKQMTMPAAGHIMHDEGSD